MERAMSNSEVLFEVITYEDEVTFNYTLPDEEEQQTIEAELTFIWEESVDAFVEKFGADKPYRVNSFKFENQHNFFLHQLESRTDAQIEEVEEEIANKMKFGFEFSGQLHNDD